MSHRGITCEVAETASGPGHGTGGDGHCTRYVALHPLRGDTPDQNGCNAYGSGAPHNARIPQRRVCHPARITRRQEHKKPQEPEAPLVWRAPEGWRARLRCPWATAGPGRASRRRAEPPISSPGSTGVEGAGGMEGQAAVPVGGGGAWPGFEPTLRAKLAARTARGRAAAHGHTKQPGPTRQTTQRPEHPWGNKQHHKGTHNETRPRPVARPRPRHVHAAPFTTAPPAIRQSCPRDPRPRRGQPRGGQRGRGTGSRTRSRHPRCGRSGSTAGRHRARHTRRA